MKKSRFLPVVAAVMLAAFSYLSDAVAQSVNGPPGPTLTFASCLGNVTFGPGNTGTVNFTLPVVSSITGSAFVWSRDNCKILNYKGGVSTYTLPAAVPGIWVPLQNNGSGLLTLNAGTATINGAGAIAVPTGSGGVIATDDTGSNFVFITSVSAGGAGVSSFNTRTGVVTLQASDVGAIVGATAPVHQFFNQLTAAGVFNSAQPACGDLSNAAASCSTDATNANNIGSGTLPNARLSAVPNSALANSQVTIGTTAVSLGATLAALTGRGPNGLNIDQLTNTIGDANASIAATTRVAGTSVALTLARTWQLPTANSLNAGQALFVLDFVGGVTGTNTLTIARVGTDTINGGSSVVINAAFGGYVLISDGVGKWYAFPTSVSAVSGVSSVSTSSPDLSIPSGTGGVTIDTTEAFNTIASLPATLATTSLKKLTIVTVPGTLTIPDPGSAGFPTGSSFKWILNRSSGNITISRQTSGTINGFVSLTLTPGAVSCPKNDGTTDWKDPCSQPVSANDALTAAGTNQATALALTAVVNRLTTCASGTGVELFPAYPGAIEVVINACANAEQVYGTGSDQINLAAAATGVSQPVNSTALCSAAAAGNWGCALIPTGSGITQLIGPVLAGPGSGPQASSLNPAAQAIPNGWTGTTQAANDNSTKIATTAYVDKPTTFTTGSGTITLSGARNIVECTAACTIVLPTPAAGMEQCVRNSDNVAAVITFGALVGIQFELQARTGYKAANTAIASTGVITDQACFLGKDSTHYDFGSATGTWS